MDPTALNACYLLIGDEVGTTHGDEHHLSLVGGHPRLPVDTEMPTCSLCGSTQTFFFQVTFPADHFWADLTMAVFACTSCGQRGHFIPEMLQGTLRGIDSPTPLLDAYQRNFQSADISTARAIS